MEFPSPELHPRHTRRTPRDCSWLLPALRAAVTPLRKHSHSPTKEKFICIDTQSRRIVREEAA
ncbi:hypothetical protein K0M31_015911 [Melipona bicolor]|uniref:Uncharacterized protein n=1 Tax=Melipona bicolor TaxID=60889 RepID=A0AA40G684_9HYME|nr:hypothetical protein K0M31_015911 [Melipona bicolor]